jgi:hypothetical protein
MSRSIYALMVLALVGAISGSSRAAGPLLSGKVTDESGRAVKAASVALESFDGATRVAMMTGPDGLFSFVDIPGGSYSLSASEPGHLFAIYGPVIIAADRSSSQNIELERLPNDGRDVVSCDRSLVWGQVAGRRKISPAETLFCMKGSSGRTCTHLAKTGSYTLYVQPARYELTLEGPGREELVSQTLDVTYCGEYRSKITLLE